MVTSVDASVWCEAPSLTQPVRGYRAVALTVADAALQLPAASRA